MGKTAGHRPTTGFGRIVGFAVVLYEPDYRDLIARRKSFSRGDYDTYLADLYRRMSMAVRNGRQVLVGPFLTDQYESFADAIGASPDGVHALRAYNDFVARVGPHTQSWTGEPMNEVIGDLRAATDTSAAEARILPLLRQAAELHREPERASARALDAATAVFTPLLEQAGDGRHTLTCTVALPRERLSYSLPFVRTADLIAFPDDGPEELLWAVLAIAHLAGRSATLLLRGRRLAGHTRDLPTDRRTPEPVTLRAWRLTAGRAEPLTDAQVFALTCTSPSGDPVPPECGARYLSAYPLH
jgi:hypothetical protein